MSFGAAGYLYLLPLAAACAAVAGWWAIWRARARVRFVMAAGRGAAASMAPLLLLAALVVTVFAAARPQAGSRDVDVEQRGIDLAIVLDTSNSMLADDAQPTRLAQSQAAIDALLERMAGNRVGLVMFAGQPFIRSPLTADLQALRGIVDGVGGERALLPPGSDVSAAILGAQRLLASDDAATKAMVIVSDGEERGSGAVGDALASATGAGIRIYTAGAGTTRGAPVRDIDEQTGVAQTRVDGAGNPVVTRLDEGALRAIAAAGGGRYVSLSDGPPLTGIAAELKELTQTTFGRKQSSEPIERFQIFALIALALLTVELAWPLLRSPHTTVWRAAKLWPLAGAGLLVGAICSTTVAELNRRGNGQYASGNLDAALAQYGTAEARAPSLDELRYNAGNALDRKEEYEKAIAETLRALPAAQALVARIEYALGNHYAGASKLADALEAYKRALLADPSDADAKHNLEVVTARLTPSPSPTPTPPERPTPPVTTTPGTQETPGANQGGTPAASPGPGGAQGTPGAGDGEMTQEELDRALAEALAGKDKQFTEEEAIRVLQLLDEANRRVVEGSKVPGATSLPDY